MNTKDKEKLFKAFSDIADISSKQENRSLFPLHIANMEYIKSQGLMNDYYQYFFENVIVKKEKPGSDEI